MIVKKDKDFEELKENSDFGFIKPNPVTLNFEIAQKDIKIKTLEGEQFVNKGDFIMTGLEQEKYSIQKEKFYDKYENLNFTNEFKGNASKKINSKTIYEYLKPKLKSYAYMNNQKFELFDNDYLIKYGENDFGIVKENLFNILYTKI